jgi:hypothetical protein
MAEANGGQGDRGTRRQGDKETRRQGDELAAQIAAGEPFFCEIVEEGQVLFDAGGVYVWLCRRVAAARERWGLERTVDGWRWATG